MKIFSTSRQQDYQKNLVVSFFVMFLFMASCGQDQEANLSHIDDPETRGGTEELPWHFHTGEGYLVTDYSDFDTNKSVRVRSSCELTVDKEFLDPDCREKVYYFTRSEIMTYIGIAKDLYESKIETATATSMAVSTVAVISAKTAYAGLIAPDPTVITSKLIAAGAAVGAGIAGIVVAWQGKKIYEMLSLIGKIDDLLIAEELFIHRCGHVRKNFLSEAEKLGVTIIFPRRGGDFIPGSEYVESAAKEKALFTKTLDYARDNRITSRKAYKSYFVNQCGQLPMVQTSENAELFSIDWKNVPENIKQETLKTSQLLNLKSGSVIEFGKFDSNDLEPVKAQNRILAFLRNLNTKIKYLEKNNPRKLERLRKSVDKIMIQPVWKGWSLFSRKETFSRKTMQGKKYVFFNALWSWSGKDMEINSDEFFSKI